MDDPADRQRSHADVDHCRRCCDLWLSFRPAHSNSAWSGMSCQSRGLVRPRDRDAIVRVVGFISANQGCFLVCAATSVALRQAMAAESALAVAVIQPTRVTRGVASASDTMSPRDA